MDTSETRKLHSEVSLAGFRAHAAAIGLLQLIRELRRAEVLSDSAAGRVRDAIIDDLALSRSVHVEEREFRERLKTRLDKLMDVG
jgi:hypothetical protein